MKIKKPLEFAEVIDKNEESEAKRNFNNVESNEESNEE